MNEECQRYVGNRETLALVPTMGSLHEGHLSLIRTASERCDQVVVSIFVNPTQFGPNEDLDNYPRDEARDLELAMKAGATAGFCPSPKDMYPDGFQTTVAVGKLADHLCGRSRKGHFAGVATVVTKLLNIVSPNAVFFGQKDFQQLAIIKRVVRDLSIDVEVIGLPIVREPSGLAMSSRNGYLSLEARDDATSLSMGLFAARELFLQGERSAAALVAKARSIIELPPVITVEYLELCDSLSLETVAEVTDECVLAVAARVENTRLIDNVILSPNG